MEGVWLSAGGTGLLCRGPGLSFRCCELITESVSIQRNYTPLTNTGRQMEPWGGAFNICDGEEDVLL